MRFSKSHLEYIKDDIGEHIYVAKNRNIVVRAEKGSNMLDPIYRKFIELADYKTINDKEDYELYLEFLTKYIKEEEHIREKKIILACSMGKDSAAGFAILYELWNRGVIRYSPLAVFTYMPILEDPILYLADKFISKFGEFLYIIQVPKEQILEKLETIGYPTLQEKWCRAIKMGSIKKFMKKFPKEDIVYAECERMFESVKRLRSLYGSRIIFPRKINPVLYLSESDVFYICQLYDIVHGMYEYGAPRTSCMLCPYASSVCHILHIWLCEKINVNIEPIIRSMNKLLRYYSEIGLSNIVKNIDDIIRLGLYSYRHTREEVLEKIKLIEEIYRTGVEETIEKYAERSRRYFFEYLRKVEYIPAWRIESPKKIEKKLRERAKDLIKSIVQRS
ncbi:MAG: hypothetical protein GXO26_07275 [Crenarchaeota archaeon]|nr:hypothetical protein [Thermoproteota archaeon]